MSDLASATTGTHMSEPSRNSFKGFVAYAAPGAPEAMILYCAAMVIPGFFTTEIGLSAAFVGVVYTVSRLFDAVTDIGIGYFSDRTKSPIGPRKPWLIAGTVVSVIAVFYLYNPSDSNPGFRYAASTFALYLGWTMAIVPYDAWGAELSRDYMDRNRIFTLRAIAYYIGSMIFLATPMLPWFSGDFDREVLRYSAWLVAIMFIGATAIAVFLAPQGRASRSGQAPTLKGILKTLLSNRPLQYYVVMFLLGGLSLGITLALSYVYVNAYLKLEGKFASILFFYVLANFIAIPFWYLVTRKVQKHKAWAIGLLIHGVCYPPLAFLTPGAAGAFWILLGLTSFSGFAYSVTNIVSKSLLGDIIDYDQLETGENHSASIFAVSALVQKLTVALGGGLSFLMLAWLGYEPSSADNSAASILFGLKFTYLILPFFLSAAAAYLLWRFPLDQARHEEIKRKLDALDG
jgi:glycoside/pentoside/hexuronide:cation symporter, GPH family